MLNRRLGAIAGKILAGAKPSDLPVELPATFELVVNLGSARLQGLAIPRWVLLRADAFKAMAAKAGASVKSIYGTLGHYDLVVTVEAPDAATATSLNLAVAPLGNIRTETLAAFSAEEFGEILGKMPWSALAPPPRA